MSGTTYSVIRGGLIVANAMLLSALVILLFIQNVPDAAKVHSLYQAAQALRELTFAVCFEIVFGSALIEEYIKKKCR